jgi:2-polyprenyl-6-methoxyphenol hydroxylase-like FAD-dependent oxidoreductase
MTVKCRSWSQGRVVVVGDAAHGMAPNLGQGANMTFTNAVSLAAAVTEGSDVASALRSWETRERPLTEHVQRWSHGYGTVVSKWPAPALPLRGPLLQMATAIPWVDNQLNRAARHRPVGSWAPALRASAPPSAG